MTNRRPRGPRPVWAPLPPYRPKRVPLRVVLGRRLAAMLVIFGLIALATLSMHFGPASQ